MNVKSRGVKLSVFSGFILACGNVGNDDYDAPGTRKAGEMGQGVTGDIDKNGTVNVLDLVLVANHIGEQAEPSVSD